MLNINSKFQDEFELNGKKYFFYSLNKVAKELNDDLSKMPFSLKILLENLLRFLDEDLVTFEDIKACFEWVKEGKINHEISFMPSRVLMQDFTGVPAIVDLAAMRDAVMNLGGDATKINPLSPVDLVIDHSVQVDFYGEKDSLNKNTELEYHRNQERYEFVKWGQNVFNNFKVVPPGTGICHQVNLEYLARVVFDNNGVLYPDTVFGTDSHTTMVNGLGVLGWGVGGIEAEAAMLGQASSMLIPEIIGVKLSGKLPSFITATDLVLTITEALRKKGVVNKFVEFFGPGLTNLSIADRATIANMAPEYGATCGFFPIDHKTLEYLKLSNRDENHIKLVEKYAKIQGLWRDDNLSDLKFTDILEIDLTKIEPSLAGPKRPQDRVVIGKAQDSIAKLISDTIKNNNIGAKFAEVEGQEYKLAHGDLVIAAITSCTNTSNPSVMLAAGLVAKKAFEKGLKSADWVKTSLAPGSQVVSEYLKISGLQDYLDKLGFNIVGYGCTTCIGNSGPLRKEIEESISNNNLIASAILSGNRNFEGRVHQLVKANYLASPPLVVAYAIAGTMNINLLEDALGHDPDDNPVYLKDIWPSKEEIEEIESKVITAELFASKYQDVFKGDTKWNELEFKNSSKYDWNKNSTYIANPPYFEDMKIKPSQLKDIHQARLLAAFGDSITTDHISPAGNIAKTSPAAKYLQNNGIEPREFNSYGARRGNHEVMMRGTFANIRIKNLLLNNVEGGFTKFWPTNEQMSIYDAAMNYKKINTPLIIIAGKEYGTGSSRDWAAKGTCLLGVKAVIAESFERIHRSNLLLMGVLPLMFKEGMKYQDLNLNGDESFDILGLEEGLKAKMDLRLVVHRANGKQEVVSLLCRVDTAIEVNYFVNGGIMPYVVREMLK